MQDAPTALSKTGTVSLALRKNREILDRVIDYMETYDIPPYDEVTGKGLIRHTFSVTVTIQERDHGLYCCQWQQASTSPGAGESSERNPAHNQHYSEY